MPSAMFYPLFTEIWLCEYPYFTVPLWFPATRFVIFVLKFLARDARRRHREHPLSRSISSRFLFNDRSTQLFPWIWGPSTKWWLVKSEVIQKSLFGIWNPFFFLIIVFICVILLELIIRKKSCHIFPKQKVNRFTTKIKRIQQSHGFI